MGVHRGVLVAVLDEHHIAKTVLHTRELHHAVPHTAHRGAGGGRVIKAAVGSPFLQNGMKAHFEAACDAGKFHWRGQVDTPQALSVERVVAPLGASYWLTEPHGLEFFPAVDKLGAEHPPTAQGLAIAFKGFVDDGEPVALAQCAMEIDVPSKYFSHLYRNRIRNACLVGSSKQRALDTAAGQSRRNGERGGFQPGHPSPANGFDHQAFELAVILGAPARAEFLQGVLPGGLSAHQASTAA